MDKKNYTDVNDLSLGVKLVAGTLAFIMVGTMVAIFVLLTGNIIKFLWEGLFG